MIPNVAPRNAGTRHAERIAKRDVKAEVFRPRSSRTHTSKGV
jgi:hypothetical protein